MSFWKIWPSLPIISDKFREKMAKIASRWTGIPGEYLDNMDNGLQQVMGDLNGKENTLGSHWGQ